MAIQPVDLPQAAGIEYGKGDVRHFSPGDAQDVPSLQNPTRHLAQRDNLLAEKVNEVIEAVNNQEQFVPLPIIRTVLPPMDETIVANYRIPEGFESRILNATVASSPVSADIELNIYYDTGFGNVTGTSLVTTATEYSGGVSFYQKGEFIIGLKNKTGTTLELVASVLLTLRPIGSQGGLLVASVVKGDKGDPGPTGPRGIQGPPGTGGAGSPGMVWQGDWSVSTPYVEKEVVSFELYGSVLSSFICVQANTGQSPQDSYLSAAGFWEPVAIGYVGPTGPTGPVGSGAQPDIGIQLLDGTFVTGADYVSCTSDAAYLGGGTPSQTYIMSSSVVQGSVGGTSGSLAWINLTQQRYFVGNGTLRLPVQGNQASGGVALANYDTSSIKCCVVSNGTDPANESIRVSAESSTDFAIKVLAPNPVRLSINLSGMQSY